MTLWSRLSHNRLFQKAKKPLEKVGKDNIGALTAIVAWNCLASLVPIMAGIIAISGLLLQGHSSTQHSVVVHLSRALAGILSPKDLNDIVRATLRHTGLLGLVGLVGVFWGGSNIGGAISTTFQAIFETSGRNFIKEKILDIVMIVVITVLMIVIIVGTTATAFINRLTSSFPLSGATSFIIGIVISVVAGFMLFTAIYIAFPNTQPRLKLRHVWQGAVIAAVLFQILTFIWPLYTHFTHFSRYGAILFPILLLVAWIYFFSTILMVGAEFVAIGAILEANREKVPIGPEPQETVPQHRVLRKI